MIFNGGTPFVIAGSVAGSLTALERLRASGAETIVPGHARCAIRRSSTIWPPTSGSYRSWLERASSQDSCPSRPPVGRTWGGLQAGTTPSGWRATYTGPTRRSKASL
ncbi:MAG: hypothetical protein IH862_00390 [Chloroflexi bacterium]|nr:hypothetical protein [Chloroflexota bacterium]